MSLKITHVAKQNAENTVMCFHSNNGSVNTPQCNIIHIIDILFDHLHNYTFFQQDSTKAHTANKSMPGLERYGTRIVRRGLGPPHFLDLNLRDSYLLGMWTMHDSHNENNLEREAEYLRSNMVVFTYQCCQGNATMCCVLSYVTETLKWKQNTQFSYGY
jgi:hypothetical protein